MTDTSPAAVKPSKYDMSIHSNPDAAAWAAFFKQTFPDSDEDLMHGWFSNAMMAMHDHVRGERDALASQLAAANARCEMLADSVGKAQANTQDDPFKKPAPAVTVQEAARVLLGCPQLSQIGSVPVIASTRALRAVGGQIVQGDALSAIRAALRAIAGGGDE